MKSVIVTTSWDDGHKLDVRLAKLLKKYDIQGTFYVTKKNQEQNPSDLLTEDQIRELSDSFEVGAHTISHKVLTTISDDEAQAEIGDSKTYLESVTGKPVSSFCYPRGIYSSEHVNMVRNLGFLYARTVKRHSFGTKGFPFEAETTIHTYNHWLDLWKIFRFAKFNPIRAIRYFQWDNLAKAMFDRVLETGGVFHLWGHSWEIEKHNDWEKLEDVFRYIARKKEVRYVTNAEIQDVFPKKILIAAPYFPPHLGGTEFYVYNIAKGLEEKFGWGVVVATTGGRGFKVVKEIYGSLTVYKLPYWFKISNTPISLFWGANFRKIIKNENILLVNAHAPVPLFADIAIRSAGSTPTVLTYHMLSMKKNIRTLDWMISLYEHWILPRTLNRVNSVVCASRSVLNNFSLLFKKEPTIITPGVDSNFFVPETHYCKNTILFVGSLNKNDTHKGLKYLLVAMEGVLNKYPEAKLLIAGTGDGVDDFKMLAQELKIIKSVHFLGGKYGKELRDVYQQSNIFVLPSLNDNHPLVVLEAMACGLPVVATNVGSLTGIVEDGKTGFLVSPGDSVALSEKIVALLDSPVTARNLGDNGRNKILREFDWQERVASYDRIFNKEISDMQSEGTKPQALLKVQSILNNKEQLSVVVLAYNSEKTIGATLESLVNQIDKNFRVIIVDDDSTDATLQIVNSFNKKLIVEIIRNGTNVISKGRNKGLLYSKNEFVAFLDSDDRARPDWTSTIINTFIANPNVALLSGPLLFSAKTNVGRSIAANDATVRKLFGKGVALFCTANSAFNKSILRDKYLFDEDFVYAEDLEIASRIQKHYKWMFVPEMKIDFSSRESLKGYAIQMYRYGMWKIYYGFVERDYRFIDFVPLAIIVVGIFLSFVFESLIPLLLLVVFSFLESLFVIFVARPKPSVALFVFPAWLVKNYAWSLGVVVGVTTLFFDRKKRSVFELKKLGRNMHY